MSSRSRTNGLGLAHFKSAFFARALVCSHTSSPVSYTHLDVYKRQSLYRISRQRIFRNSQRRATNILVPQLELMSEPVGNSLQDKNCLLSDFGTDPVAGEDCEV